MAGWTTEERIYLLEQMEISLAAGKTIHKACQDLSNKPELNYRNTGTINSQYVFLAKGRDRKNNNKDGSSFCEETSNEVASTKEARDITANKYIVNNITRVAAKNSIQDSRTSLETTLYEEKENVDKGYLVNEEVSTRSIVRSATNNPLENSTGSVIQDYGMGNVAQGYGRSSRVRAYGANEETGLSLDRETVIDAFEGLPNYIYALNKKVESLEAQISYPKLSLESLVDCLVSSSDSLREASAFRENLRIKDEEVATLKESLSDVQSKLNRVEKDYKDACDWFEMFMNKSSINQMMNLGELRHKMKTVLDQWGVVMRLEIIEGD